MPYQLRLMYYATALPKDIFPNEKFSLALDKGTLDAFLALGESGWINPNEENNDDLSWVTAMKK